MANDPKSSGNGKNQLVYDGLTIKGGVVKPSSNPNPRPPAPTGQGSSSETTNQQVGEKK